MLINQVSAAVVFLPPTQPGGGASDPANPAHWPAVTDGGIPVDISEDKSNAGGTRTRSTPFGAGVKIKWKYKLKNTMTGVIDAKFTEKLVDPSTS